MIPVTPGGEHMLVSGRFPFPHPKIRRCPRWYLEYVITRALSTLPVASCVASNVVLGRNSVHVDGCVLLHSCWLVIASG
jgi:hypothetical protein